MGRNHHFLILALIMQTPLPAPSSAVTPTIDELHIAQQWGAHHLDAPEAVASLPFSFIYDGRPSRELLGGWKHESSTTQLDEQRTQNVHTYTDPATGLSVRCVSVTYADFPTVEWTLYLKNNGQADTPIIQEILPLNTRFEGRGTKEYLLHFHEGSQSRAIDYMPELCPLPPGAIKRCQSLDGRPSDAGFPYFNLSYDDGGVIVVIGWPGQWAVSIQRDTGTGLHVSGGQEATRFFLHPGEEVRSPLIVLQFYRGDWLRAQNVWRRWMIAHNLPRPGGKLPPIQMAAASSYQYGEMIHANEQNQKMFIDRYLNNGLKIDYWWMDAGWYPNDGRWQQTGTWEVDTKRFPNGLRAISDYAHERGVKILVWFEPERVAPGTWLTEQHPEWIHGGAEGGLLKVGEDEVRTWLTDHIDALLDEQGIDLYRQDFNFKPLKVWRQADAKDRQGITEIRHVTGYLAYFDELRRRRPDMLIDTCAGGGRRNDLETLRRAVPLHRSDHVLNPVGQQNQTYGMSLWIPFYGCGFDHFDAYGVRSCMCPHMTGCFDMRRDDQDFEPVRRLIRQWREVIAPNYYGDFWPLTPYSYEDDAWMAYQFDRPEIGRGVALAFRRAENTETSRVLKLHGLDTDATYTITDLDSGISRSVSGRDLTVEGLRVDLPDRPSSCVLSYEKDG